MRILITKGILEIRRGKGTYVTKNTEGTDELNLDELSKVKIDMKDLYEMRLIFEPEAAYYATERASENELNRILLYGRKVEEKIKNGEDRTEEEQIFHKSIAKATHNEFMNKLMPILHKSINKGVTLSTNNQKAVEDTLNDHRLIMDFLKQRNAEGARLAMKLHIMHAMEELGIRN